MTERDKLICSNTGLVHACASKFKGKGIDYEDLYSCGCVGLIKAADNFDPSLGYKFSTYAVPVILGEIKRIFRDTGAIKVSRSLKELGLRINRVCEEYYREHLCTPLSDIYQPNALQMRSAASSGERQVLSMRI